MMLTLVRLVTCLSTQIKHSGTVSACGLAAGMPLPTTVIVNFLETKRKKSTVIINVSTITFAKIILNLLLLLQTAGCPLYPARGHSCWG